ncbi:SUMF1/EgtB/PvdO family nonheme iron enzyme [Flavilitoribacter nigricans]|uniref:Caspase family p20 domain-containing protein n=1 Tax=Flavilitoribacter nigricans (strain ATCC 23147 / DSM 23189 / NBRC 102662 / NCIMB 1420 / SS-2) TaxID=1122177 RepID=A0A2D0MY76_FLAN2|nr:SUMF1/EgtB/PvdO family nonheme iron enzyme [Flavilitoribacter nigricans]PHN01232.1 hypothetical protein CRP01_38145 [Flavilitoribacter nigricans DSM 23189 = NBRC 102662]
MYALFKPSLIFWFFTIIFSVPNIVHSQNYNGQDYAFIFYNTHFTKGWTPLTEVEKEVKILSKELTESYQFKVEQFANLTNDELHEKLKEINSRPFTAQDQVLFFFSSHGLYKEHSNQGYLIPSDGPKASRYGEGWLSYGQLRDYLGENRAKHILVALDACHSGAFGNRYRGHPKGLPWQGEVNCETLARSSLRYRSRLYFSSGNKMERTPAESVFVDRWLQCLRELPRKGRYVVSSNDLEQYVNTISVSSPENGTFYGHEPSGEFVFVHKDVCQPGVVDQVKRQPPPKVVDSRKVIAIPKLTDIPGGTFKMGRKTGTTFGTADHVHLVEVGPFAIAPVEVTFENFDAYCEEKKLPLPEDEGWGRGKQPVINVSWFDAVNYCNWLSEKFGYQKVYQINGGEVFADLKANGYRLPTEAEWEYVASRPAHSGGGNYLRRGEGQADFGNGKSIADPGELNFDASPGLKTNSSITGYSREQPVQSGSLANANPLFLFDLSGNVAEWCNDWYADDFYTYSPKENPVGPLGGTRRVIRGGSFQDGPNEIQSFSRDSRPPIYRGKTLGFRLARNL